MNIQQAVALRMLQLLKEKKMTRYALGRKAGIDDIVLYNIIKRTTTKDVKMNTVVLIAEGFDMTVSEFLDDPLFNIDNLETY
jgi:transcriptional regulator with XRE-family HTH domain